MTPLERADEAREEWSANKGQHLVAEEYLPPGSLIFRDESEMLVYLRDKGFVPLAPDEAELMTLVVESAMCGRLARADALALLAGKGQT